MVLMLVFVVFGQVQPAAGRLKPGVSESSIALYLNLFGIIGGGWEARP